MHKILSPALVSLVRYGTRAVSAPAYANEVAHREALIRHFFQYNLLPVFLPRDQAVSPTAPGRNTPVNSLSDELTPAMLLKLLSSVGPLVVPSFLFFALNMVDAFEPRAFI